MGFSEQLKIELAAFQKSKRDDESLLKIALDFVSSIGFFAVVLFVVVSVLSACSDAQTVSHNISVAADNFKIDRRIVFYDAIQGDYLLVIEGRCSIEADSLDGQLEVTCKTGHNKYKKHFFRHF